MLLQGCNRLPMEPEACKTKLGTLTWESMQSDANLPTLDAVVGRNLAAYRRRRDWTQDQLATFLRDRGLGLSASALAALETGRRKVTFGEAIVLAVALGIAPQELATGEGPVALTPSCRAELGSVRAVLASRQGDGLTVAAAAGFDFADDVLARGLEEMATRFATLDALAAWIRLSPDMPARRLDEALDWARQEAEVRTARRLGVKPLEVAFASLALWRSSLTHERERRAAPRIGPGSSERSARSVRAHVTRELEAEVRDRIEGSK